MAIDRRVFRLLCISPDRADLEKSASVASYFFNAFWGIAYRRNASRQPCRAARPRLDFITFAVVDASSTDFSLRSVCALHLQILTNGVCEIPRGLTNESTRTHNCRCRLRREMFKASHLYISQHRSAVVEIWLPNTGHSPKTGSGPKRRFENRSFRPQSGRSRVWIDCPKAEIYYRLPA